MMTMMIMTMMMIQDKVHEDNEGHDKKQLSNMNLPEAGISSWMHVGHLRKSRSKEMEMK